MTTTISEPRDAINCTAPNHAPRAAKFCLAVKVKNKHESTLFHFPVYLFLHTKTLTP
jgi:hypothetical protein